jgi:CBS domain-containing protein
MIIVKDIMTTDLITVTPDMDICRATKILFDNRINGAPVMDDSGRLVGILCQSDLITQQKKLPIPTIFTFLDGLIRLTSTKQIEKQVRKIAALTVKPVTVRPDTGVETVAALMVDRNFHTLPVVEDSRLVGIICKEDVLRTLIPDAENH